jgi:hypothetical protein
MAEAGVDDVEAKITDRTGARRGYEKHRPRHDGA